MKCVIVSGGNPPDLQLLKHELKGGALLICADSGADFLCRNHIAPEVLLGDFDSMDESAMSWFNEGTTTRVIRYPRDKDYTDTFLAVEKAIEMGANEIVLLGCTGTRLDHVMANYNLLYSCLKRGITARITDAHNNIRIINESTVIDRDERFKYLSLFAYGGDVRNLSIKNAKYELHDYDLHIGDSLTVSNEFKEGQVQVSFDEGMLAIFMSVD